LNRYSTAFSTSKGGHPVNEDSVKIIKKDGKLTAILADGLGAHGGGEIASAAVVAAVERTLPDTGITGGDILIRCIEAANNEVLGNQRPGLQMKSTAVILTIEDGKAAFAHVGDSRGYYFRNGLIAHQTMDHSVSQMAVLSGEITFAEIRFHESRSKLLRVLGVEGKPGLALKQMEGLLPGDAFLLCSDGFWEYVTEDEMCVDLLKSSVAADWLSYMLARAGARVARGHDNMSAICVRVG
jgi:serine/threonine protein phosphatase PrpC